MKNTTIVKSIIGLASTGVTVTGATFLTLSSQKKEQIDIEKQKLVARGVKRKEGLKLLESVFSKWKDSEGNNKELANIIDKRLGSHIFFTIGSDGHFLDSSDAESSFLYWCEGTGESEVIPSKFAEDLNKEKICSFVNT
ncbi:hypothetical protein A6V39_05400 [Candidatus Mycoplasma haematobovis]|uniref:Uncharacterized protein n=1 Tax=Candidatus Mycoplasma haematobovis TaxID=432608 RepID=A0A1A9QCM9_9MOLU|nr:hypothetical protein [Candidatus Mycoplasma haematobovis]OAL09771.1 hypothetical protein A6V39_05400 [Candidatus Mycoplasma haematobovis]